MAISSKTLFLGVHASSAFVKNLFKPLSYLFLLSPFAVLTIRYAAKNSEVFNAIPADFDFKGLGLQVLFAATWACILTRFLSNRGADARINGKRRVPNLPYWIPGLRHWVSVVFGGEKWLKGVRESALTDILAYKSAGAKHNIVLSPALLDRIVGNTNSLDEADLTRWVVPHNVFGLPQGSKAQYFQLHPLISETLATEIFKGKGLQTITSATLHALSQSLPDLITFNSSMVDQLDWERVAGIELTDGTEEAECDLFALVNQFLANAIIPPLTGPQFYESYQLLASDLVTLNQHHYILALGLPRFFPLPGLPGASLAKKRLLQNFTKLFDELANPPAKRVISDDDSLSGEETDADAPTPITALHDIFSKHGIPISARASIGLEVIQRIFAQAIPLAFWTILHIYRASSQTADYVNGETPLLRIREETKKWSEAIQPPSIHPSFPSPPEISFTNTSSLFNPSSFPYLRSCIFETKRIYSSSITTAVLRKPLVFTEGTNRGDKEEWELETGSYLDIGLSQRLINISPANYVSPDEYKPERFGAAQPPSPLAASIFNDSEELVTSLLVTFIAGVTQLWNISAAPKKSMFQQFQEAQAAVAGEKPNTSQAAGQERKAGVWRIPKTVEGANVLMPKDDIRVRIMRRNGLEERPKFVKSQK